MSKLYHQFIGKEELEEQDITEMYQLIEMYYVNVNPPRFLTALSKKDYIFFVRDEDNRICAFTTLQCIRIASKKQKLQGLFLGDVVLSEEYRKDRRMECIFSDLIIQYQDRKKKVDEKYIFINCKDHAIYQMFKKTFPSGYIYEQREMPKHLKKAINIFKENYCNQESEAVLFKRANQEKTDSILCIAEILDLKIVPNV